MKLCMGCMREIEDNVTECPFCNYDETVNQQESYYLTPGSIIGGKYIVGKALEYSGYTVRYIGMDAEKNAKVIICEYLPSDFATRSDGEKAITIYSGDALEQFNQGLMTFLNEGNQIQQMGCIPGIAQVYDCVAENDTGYLIEEYIEGEKLSYILATGRRYLAEEAKRIILEILGGLQQIHSMGIIHCDIAPENIMMDVQGHAKLFNFGAIRYVTTANSKSLAIILKQGYAAEEQYRGQGKRGSWTDVYALAAVMYQMITGKVPAESVDRALEDTLAEPSKWESSIPKGMENALMNALNVFQENRTASAADFYRELQASDTKRRKVKRMRRETGKLPIWVKGLVAIVACAVIVGGVVLVRSHERNKKRQAETENSVQFSRGINETYKSFMRKWEEEYHFDEKLVQVEYHYDSNLKEGTICEFEDLSAGEDEAYQDFPDDSFVDGRNIADFSKAVTDFAENNPEKNLVKLVVASQDEITFGVVCKENNKNNYSLNTKDDERISYDQAALPQSRVKISDDVSMPFGIVKTVKYQGEEKSPGILVKENLKLKDLEIEIYNGKYYWMEGNANENYVGRKVSDILFCYGKENENNDNKKIKPNQALKPEYYDENYYSLTKEAGTVAEVKSEKLKAGKKYDERKDGKIVFDTVRQQIGTLGKITVAELEKYCKIKNRSQFDGNYYVTDIDQDYFTRNTEVTIQAVPPATPSPTQAPVQESVPQQPKQPQQPGSTKSNDTPEYKSGGHL